MTSDDLTKSQAKAIREALFPGVNYLYRLKTRMEKTGFPGTDKLYQLVCAAYESSNRLSNEVHYMSCDGVGREPRRDRCKAIRGRAIQHIWISRAYTGGVVVFPLNRRMIAI